MMNQTTRGEEAGKQNGDGGAGLGAGTGNHPPMGQGSNQPLVWYCPSRWLLAHHDLKANINTMSSHMCLADLNNDGENLMALIDFKPVRQGPPAAMMSPEETNGQSVSKAPYTCRMRVYKGQQLIYNHFLDDTPSCLIVSSISLPTVSRPRARLGNNFVSKIDSISGGGGQQSSTNNNEPQQQPLLTMAINDDVYFYHKLKPSHKLSLEDEECVLDSLNRSEVDAWQMVRQNKVDTETMRELLVSLSQEFGNQELSSHSHNFIALSSLEARRQYLIAWKLKRLQQSNNLGEQIMSMDTICCSAARLKYSSNITRSGDFGQTRDKASLMNNARCNRIIDIQKDGLLLGTEDRHLLIYELRSIRTRLECHYRLRTAPDHILVERRSPMSFDLKQDLRTLTYKILVSCRNCRIYCIDQLYLVDEKSSPCDVKELVALKSNVVEMCWTGLQDDTSVGRRDSKGVQPPPDRSSTPTFVVACLDRQVYCFNSETGHCKWIIELELPITCLICLPKLQIGSEEASLIGVGSQANRVDFYVGSSGRIVDSIYFSQDDYPQAMTFGRFGREDNCLCLITSLGRLVVLILKRTAKFAHGQCLSSAASHASYTLASCRQILKESVVNNTNNNNNNSAHNDLHHHGVAAGDKGSSNKQQHRQQHQLTLSEPTNLPSAFALSKSSSTNVTDQMIESILHPNHSCDQTSLKSALDIHSSRPRLQIPVKGRDFVEQILEQSRASHQMSQVFASQMIKLRNKIRSTFEQKGPGFGGGGGRAGIETSCHDEEAGNRLVLTRVIGLGNIYRISLALRLNVEKFVERYHELLLSSGLDSPSDQKKQQQQPAHVVACSSSTPTWSLACFLKPRTSNLNKRPCQVRPFKFEVAIEEDSQANYMIKSICETTIEAKLAMLGLSSLEPLDGEFIPIDLLVLAYYHLGPSTTIIQRPFYQTTINIPLVA